jgi:hypothetical protein
MKSIPDLNSIQKIIFDENECIKFLIDNNLIIKPQNCYNCNSIKLYRDKKIFKCNTCKKSISIFNNSFFANRNLACNKVLLIGYLWLTKANYTTIKSITNYSPRTIVKYIKIFQEVAINSLTNNDTLLGGFNIKVEVDESKFRKNEDFWVVGLIERTEEKKCYFEVVENRNTETLTKIIKKHVKPGSIVYTDR